MPEAKKQPNVIFEYMYICDPSKRFLCSLILLSEGARGSCITPHYIQSNLLKESRMLHVRAQSCYRKRFYDKSTWKSQLCRQLNLLDWQGSTPLGIGPLGCTWHLTGGTLRNCYPHNSSARTPDTTKCTLLFLFCSTVSPKGFACF